MSIDATTTSTVTTTSTSTTIDSTDTKSFMFDSISAVSERFKKPAAKVNLFLEQFVDLDTRKFEWDNLQAGLKDKRDPDFTLVELQSDSIVSSRKEYTFAQSITKLLKEGLNVAIPDSEIRAIETKVSTIFGDVRSQNDIGFWNVYRNEQGHNEGFEYKLLYHVPDGDSKHTFLTLVLNFFIKADIKKSSGWFWDSTSENYSVDLKSAKFLVFDTFSV